VTNGGAVAQLGARLDGIEEVVGSNPIGSTNSEKSRPENRSWLFFSLLLFPAAVPAKCSRLKSREGDESFQEEPGKG
jgi:hypothetical protein